MANGEARSAAIRHLEAGRADKGLEGLLQVARAEVDPELLNDLAVASQMVGDLDAAEALLRAAHVIGGERRDVLENLEAVASLRAAEERAWRTAHGIAGQDPEGIPERAHPGMALFGTLGEHCVRYSLAISLLGRQDVLDLGCGTGYGSEMLTWSARRVRGFDLWQPTESERPRWPGGAELHYGHDLCRDPLPPAEGATMFEVLEHLPDVPAALDLAFRSVSTLIASFPNPKYHGSHLNPHHVNDWPLEQVETIVTEAAARYHTGVAIEHLQQRVIELRPGRDPEAVFWVLVVRTADRMSR